MRAQAAVGLLGRELTDHVEAAGAAQDEEEGGEDHGGGHEDDQAAGHRRREQRDGADDDGEASAAEPQRWRQRRQRSLCKVDQSSGVGRCLADRDDKTRLPRDAAPESCKTP